ncbi:MAG: protein LphA [Legionellaceae bacterium]|nr:protein LphA [Legionellaceae bacterium]
MLIFRFGRYSLFLALALALGACKPTYVPDEDPRLILPPHVKNTTDKQRLDLQKKLNGEGIRVITMGDDFLISIPAQDIFATQSSRIKWESYKPLNHVAAFLKSYRKIEVTITNFVLPYRTLARQYALAVARSKEVGRYLRSQGIDGRVIFENATVEKVNRDSCGMAGDKNKRSRIEIVFRNALI